MPPQVAVIVLNWNGKDDTLACLRSLQQQNVECELVMVDNGSTDDSVVAVRRQFPSVTVIEIGANLGYAGGNNTGIKYALDKELEYVLVLNNDTILDPKCISLLLAEMEMHSDVAATAPKSFSHTAPETVDFAGGKISPDGITLYVDVNEDGIASETPFDTEWLTGCAMMLRGKTLRQVGLFENAYYLLYEDVDWSMRARRASFRLKIVPGAKLWHKVSQSFGKTWSPKYLYYHTRNSLLWIERNFPLRHKPRLYYVALRRTIGNLLLRKQKLSAEEKYRVRRAVFFGFIDYFLHRFGQQDHFG